MFPRDEETDDLAFDFDGVSVSASALTDARLDVEDENVFDKGGHSLPQLKQEFVTLTAAQPIPSNVDGRRGSGNANPEVEKNAQVAFKYQGRTVDPSHPQIDQGQNHVLP